MTDEQKQPEKDEEVEAHHWKTGPAEDAEALKSRKDDEDEDVEAHHWKTGPSETRVAGPERHL